MHPVQIISYILIIVTVVISYKAFRDEAFFDKYIFHVDPILPGRQYYRIISAGFIHNSWMHLAVNMLSLFFFGLAVESFMGPLNFLLVYFVSLIAGNLFALYIHRNHGDYSATGASGAVCGIIFASIALFPGIQIFFVPGWLFGTLYVIYTVYGMRTQRDNIGHEAHLGGAIAGMITAVVLAPWSISANYPVILSILISTSLALLFLMRRPYTPVRSVFVSKKEQGYQTIEDRYNADRNNQQQVVNELLEKVHRKGIGSLTKKERDLLERYSKQA